MKRKGEFLCVVTGLVLLSFPLRNHFDRSREMARRGSCQNNLKQIALGLKQYSNDYDEHLPLTALSNTPYGKNWAPYGWFDALQPYIRCDMVNYCPSREWPDDEPPNGKADQNNSTDYWFNSNAAGVSEKRFARQEFTILTGDGADGIETANARLHRNSLPPNYAPARRHLGGANYAFADGHVKWLLPEKVTTAPAASGQYTFSVK